jgi:hypothetical protein
MGKNVDEDRPKYGSNPYPVQARVNVFNTFTLRHITTSLFRVSNLNYPLPLRTNQMQQGSSLPTQTMFHGTCFTAHFGHPFADLLLFFILTR